MHSRESLVGVKGTAPALATAWHPLLPLLMLIASPQVFAQLPQRVYTSSACISAPLRLYASSLYNDGYSRHKAHTALPSVPGPALLYKRFLATSGRVTEERRGRWRKTSNMCMTARILMHHQATARVEDPKKILKSRARTSKTCQMAAGIHPHPIDPPIWEHVCLGAVYISKVSP